MPCDVRWRVPKAAYFRVSGHGVIPAEYLVDLRYVHWRYCLHDMRCGLVWRYSGNRLGHNCCELMRNLLLSYVDFGWNGNSLYAGLSFVIDVNKFERSAEHLDHCEMRNCLLHCLDCDLDES